MRFSSSSASDRWPSKSDCNASSWLCRAIIPAAVSASDRRRCHPAPNQCPSGVTTDCPGDKSRQSRCASSRLSATSTACNQLLTRSGPLTWAARVPATSSANSSLLSITNAPEGSAAIPSKPLTSTSASSCAESASPNTCSMAASQPASTSREA